MGTESDKPKLVSVLEQNTLEEFVSLAQLSNKQFEAEKGITIVSGNQMVPMGQSQMIGKFVDGSLNN